MQHQSWSTEAGLPQSSVHQILQTSDGYLWLATEGGVVRYDGVSFTVFNGENEPALTSNDVTSLAEDSKGTLWVGTADGLSSVPRGGVFHSVPRGTLRHWGEKEGFPALPVLSLASADDGSLLIMTAAGLLRFNAGRFTPVTAASAEVTAIEQEPHGAILLLSDATPLVFQNGKIKPFSLPSVARKEVLKGVESGPESQVWSWTNHQVVSTSRGGEQRWETGVTLPGSRINTVFVDRGGTAWIGTNRGLVTVGPSSPRVSPVAALGANAILSLIEDAEGNIWVGTETSGLHALRPRKFHDEPGLADEEVSCLTEASDGALWIGTRDDGVRRIRPGASGSTVETPAANQELTSPVILSLTAGRDGDVWAGTPDGLTHIGRDGATTRYTSSDGLPDDLIRSLLAEPDGTLWVGTRRGLARLRGKHVDVLTKANGLGGDLVGALFESSRDHALWVGTLAGLSVFDQGRFKTYARAEGLTSTLVTGLDRDGLGRLWVVTRDAGLFLFDGKRFTPIAPSHLPRELFSVTADAKGFLWMREQHGVLRASAEALAACATAPCQPIVATYGLEDGMPTEEMVTNGAPSALRTVSGEIWFATRKGVAIADTQHFSFNALPPPVVLERFLADNDEVMPGPTVPKIPSGHTRYTFDYAGLSYTVPAKVLYRFKLGGFETAWSQPGSRRYASYTNLPPGLYTFQVQAANNDGVWNEAGASFTFRILPPFYRRWWFLLTALLLSGGTVVALYLLRLRRLKSGYDALLSERNRIAREIHDTLAQDFVGVSLQLDMVSRHIARNDIPQATQQLKDTRNLVRLGLEEARQSIWNLRANIRQHSLPARVAEMARRFAADTLDVKVKTGGVYRDLPGSLEDQVLRIAQEAVSNVSRHADATRVRVQLIYGHDKLELTVEDDGRGFSTEDAKRKYGHFGLRGMHERADTLRAELDITTAVGKGTRIELTVPLSNVKGIADA